MPYINTKLNFPLSKEKEQVLKARYGQAISLIPGKSEDWLMVSFEDSVPLYFAGKKEGRIAMVEVSVFGSASEEAYGALTAELTRILAEEAGVEPKKLYIKYTETSHWGFNGNNF